MRRKTLFLIAFLILVFGCIAILDYPLWLNVGSFQRTLDTQYVPTAEYLMQNPLPTPWFIGFIDPPIGSTITANQEVYLAMFPHDYNTSGDEGEEILLNTSNIRIAINMQVIPWNATRVEFIDTMPGVVRICFNADVNRGLHIFQLEIRNSRFGAFGIGELITYRWAYRVEDEALTTPSP
jgi:hypothetical protein